jgi:hypothetical protein
MYPLWYREGIDGFQIDLVFVAWEVHPKEAFTPLQTFWRLRE